MSRVFLPIHLPFINISHGNRLLLVSKSPSTPLSALRALLIMGSHVLDMLGVPPASVRYREVSNASMSLQKGLYTGCVNDIALGNMDMCVGDWWRTAERADLGVPFVPVHQEKIRLVLKKGQRRENLVGTFSKTMNSLTTAIKPFEYNLWILIMMTMLLASLLMAVMERAERKRRVAIGEAVQLACFSFASFSSAYSPETPGGKVMGLGISFFLTVVGASFTANTAQFFIQEAGNDGYHSLRDVLDDGKPVCMTNDGVLRRVLVERYPQLKEHVNTRSEVDFFKDSDSGCFGWFVTENIMIDLWSKDRACKYDFVGQSLAQFFVGYYVAPELFQPTMYAVTHLRYNGTWSLIHKRVWPKEHAMCSSNAPTGPMQLTADHMFGPNVGLMLCCVISFLLHTSCQAARKVRGFSIVADPDDSSSADARDD